MKVKNMISNKGNSIANQFIVSDCIIELPDDKYTGNMFQSYESNICLIAYQCGNTGFINKVFLDKKYWNYSQTTGKYRNMFLGEDKKATQKKIDSGEYILINLN
jgi:hypothetical protein